MEAYRRGSNGFHVRHRLSNKFSGPLETKFMIEHFLCLHKNIYFHQHKLLHFLPQDKKLIDNTTFTLGLGLLILNMYGKWLLAGIFGWSC